MRSAIYVAPILALTAVAAPLAHPGPARGDALVAIAREVQDVPVLAARMGGDVFHELDLTARELEIEVDAPSAGKTWAMCHRMKFCVHALQKMRNETKVELYEMYCPHHWYSSALDEEMTYVSSKRPPHTACGKM
ncbi:hypothetical protein FB451DRAFT_1196030 [Mycena latifolia]|nr:hypothetical protein FB451DRAFT_1196030 [Mycena latifolia]